MSVDLIMEEARWKTLNLLQIANAAFKETLSHLNMRSENQQHGTGHLGNLVPLIMIEK